MKDPDLEQKISERGKIVQLNRVAKIFQLETLTRQLDKGAKIFWHIYSTKDHRHSNILKSGFRDLTTQKFQKIIKNLNNLQKMITRLNTLYFLQFSIPFPPCLPRKFLPKSTTLNNPQNFHNQPIMTLTLIRPNRRSQRTGILTSFTNH